jgi:hypothetical protein
MTLYETGIGHLYRVRLCWMDDGAALVMPLTRRFVLVMV